MSADFCLCGHGRPVTYRDAVTRVGFCNVCASSEITSSREVNLQYLSDLIPYREGERVQCWTMGEFYDGVGVITEVSTELRNGGTPIHPAYLVKLDDQEEPLWYTAVCFKRTRSEDFNG